MKKLLIICILAIYLYTLPRGIGLGDAGTMAAAATSLGVSHPPGFPTYMLLGNLFTHLPFGSLLLRLQLLSLLPAIALVVLMPTLFSATLVAFFYGFWSQVGNVESFILTNLFIFGLTWLSLSPTPPLVVGLLLGLGAGLNPISIVVVPVLLYIYKFSHKTLIIFGIASLTAMVVYSYLPLRAMTNPFLNWGSPMTLTSLFEYLAGGGLSISSARVVNGFTGSIQWFGNAWSRFGYLAWTQLTPLVMGLAIVGAWTLWHNQRVRLWIWMIIIFGNVSMAGLYVSGNRDLWLLTSLITLIILASEGLSRLGKLKWVVGALTLLCVVWISAPKIWDRTKTNLSQQYILDLYQHLPPNSILLGGGETFNSLTLYAHEVGGIRPDVTPVDMTIFYGQAWYRHNLSLQNLNLQTNLIEPVQFIDELEFSRVLENFALQNSPRPIFITSYLLTESVYANSRLPAYIPQRFRLSQYGLVYQLLDQVAAPIFLSNPPPQFSVSYLESNYLKAQDLLRKEYAFSFEQTGDYLLQLGQQNEAFNWYAKATQIAPQYFDQNKLSDKISGSNVCANIGSCPPL